MKTQNRVSQLTLELYSRRLATRRETKQVENALQTDAAVCKRYEALKESECEINRLVTIELNRLNIPVMTPVPRKNKALIGFVLAAAVLLCVLVPAFLYLKNRGPDKENAITESPAEETIHEINTPETETSEIKITENKPVEDAPPPPARPGGRERSGQKAVISEKAGSNEKPVIGEKAGSNEKTVISERDGSNEKTVISEGNGSNEETVISEGNGSNEEALIAESPRPGPASPAAEREIIAATGNIGSTVLPFPLPGAGVRGEGQIRDPPATSASRGEQTNIDIPAGFTSIFQNMFAYRNLSFVVIPSRITSIERNAFIGNPLIRVTIGTGVIMEENAIPGNFAGVYNSGGRAAGTYTRPNPNSEAWEKK